MTVNSVELLEAVIIRVSSIDLDQSLLGGKDRRKVAFAFVFTPETKIAHLPESSIRPLGDYIAEPFPVQAGKEVLVTWKTDPKGQKIAVMITLRETP